MWKQIFKIATATNRQLTLKNLFRASVGTSVGAVALAPKATGDFVASRITGFFNGIVQGVGNSLLSKPLILVAGITALAGVGISILNRHHR
jgi:hypothetical protein